MLVRDRERWGTSKNGRTSESVAERKLVVQSEQYTLTSCEERELLALRVPEGMTINNIERRFGGNYPKRRIK